MPAESTSQTSINLGDQDNSHFRVQLWTSGGHLKWELDIRNGNRQAAVPSQAACHLAIACPATMRVVSRDVIEHSSQTRVTSSERRHPSVGDIPNRCGTRTDPFRMFRHVTAIPEVAPASPVSVRDEWSS